jgi:hypothetical protein
MTNRKKSWRKSSWPILRYYFNIYSKRLNGFIPSVLRLKFCKNISLFPWDLHFLPHLFFLLRSMIDNKYRYEAPHYAVFFRFPVFPHPLYLKPVLFLWFARTLSYLYKLTMSGKIIILCILIFNFWNIKYTRFWNEWWYSWISSALNFLRE